MDRATLPMLSWLIFCRYPNALESYGRISAGFSNVDAESKHKRTNKPHGITEPCSYSQITKEQHGFLKPRPNALDFSLYIARQMLSIVECCREGVAKRSRLFTRLGTQHSTDVLFDE